MNLTGSKISLMIGALLFSCGFYVGVTDSDGTLLCLVLLGMGVAVMVLGFVLFLKEEQEKQDRRLKSFMSVVDHMPSGPGEEPLGKKISETLQEEDMSTLVTGKIHSKNLSIDPEKRKPAVVPEKKLSLSELPSLNQEDWDVYQDTAMDKKKK